MKTLKQKAFHNRSTWDIKQMLKFIAWPIGEEREVRIWMLMCESTPLIMATIGLSLLLVRITVPVLTLRQVIPKSRPSETITHYLWANFCMGGALPNASTINHACHTWHWLPFVVATAMAMPLVVLSYTKGRLYKPAF